MPEEPRHHLIVFKCLLIPHFLGLSEQSLCAASLFFVTVLACTSYRCGELQHLVG